MGKSGVSRAAMQGVRNLHEETKRGWESPLAVARYTQEGLRPGEVFLISSYFDRGTHVLDLGCGAGRTTAALGSLGYRVTAIDLSFPMVRETRSRVPEIDVLQMDVCELAFHDATFDHVLFSFNGLDYVYPYERRLKALGEIHRVMKPHGSLVYSSHHSLSLPFGRKRLALVWRNWLAGNRFFFSRYRIDFQPYGRLLTCYTYPWREIRLLHRMGYQRVSVYTDRADNRRDWRALLRSAWLYYVAQRSK